MRHYHWLSATVVAVLVLLSSAAHAITIDSVTVGNAGNGPDTRYNGISVGSMPYTYQIGKYDITAGQYSALLNAVATTDTYGLYSTYMDYDANPSWLGCNIKRSGTPGRYTYSVAADWADRPVNYVSWGDAARFANWLSNGQPTGGQSISTTEDGSYFLNGATTDTALMAVNRKPNATWVIPTEDEWYKAAYYDSNKPGGAGYWDYPTKSDTSPSNILSSTLSNSANFYNGGYTIGAPYYRTEVGAFAASSGPYGTFDMGGDMWQWNEYLYGYSSLRGGSFDMDSGYLAASNRGHVLLSFGGVAAQVGFRVVFLPEPGIAVMLAAVAVMTLLYWWRRRTWERGRPARLEAVARLYP